MKKVVIIGAGPGGYTTAIKLSKQGCKVILIDKNYAGGTCLNVGCIPTKSLLDHTSLFEHFKETGARKQIFNIDGEISINAEALRKFQSQVVSQLTQGLEKLFKSKNIEFIKGTAKIISSGKVEIKKAPQNGAEPIPEIIETDEIVIATGSKPKGVPTFEFNGKNVITSDEIWNIPDIPKKLLIVGSGPIGTEFARVFNVLGSEVTLAEIQESICPILDSEMSENLERSLKRRKIKIRKNFASKQISKNEEQVKVEFISTKSSDKAEDIFDKVLIAVGRTPNLEELGLKEAGIELEKGVFIKVDKNLKTTAPNIWAIGDVTSYPQLAHTASFQARVVANNIVGESCEEFNGDLIPSSVFGYPEVAFVGKTENELQGKNYKVGKSLFLASGKAKASGLTEGLVKIIMDVDTKEILGAHIIGPEASNLIQELVVAMQFNIGVDKIIKSIHGHPTYSEVVHEALEACLGEAVHA